MNPGPLTSAPQLQPWLGLFSLISFYNLLKRDVIISSTLHFLHQATLPLSLHIDYVPQKKSCPSLGLYCICNNIIVTVTQKMMTRILLPIRVKGNRAGNQLLKASVGGRGGSWQPGFSKRRVRLGKWYWPGSRGAEPPCPVPGGGDGANRTRWAPDL